MQINGSTYSRNVIQPQQSRVESNPTQIGQQQRANQANQTNKAAQQIQQVQQSAQPKQTDSVQLNLSNVQLPSNLSDVVNPEERAMLQELFPSNGSRWGVQAYNAPQNNPTGNVIGSRLNVTA